MIGVTHVFFCTDNRGMDYARVAVSSLLATVDSVVRPSVHIVTFGEIAVANRTQLEDVVAAHPTARLAWHSADDLYGRDAMAFERAGGRWNRAIWGRFFIAEFLPDYDGNVLYLDTDVLVRDDVGKLVATDLGECALGAVAEDDEPKDRDWYFNSGVLVVNLANFRKAGGTEALLAFVRRQEKALEYPDQDALNAVFSTKVFYLHPRWNYNDCWVTRHLRFRLSAKRWNGNPPQEILEAVRNPGIIHFIGGQRKPFASNHRPARRLYNRAIREIGLVPPPADFRAWFHEPFYFICRVLAAVRLLKIRSRFLGRGGALHEG